jgi:hypothetical protein
MQRHHANVTGFGSPLQWFAPIMWTMISVTTVGVCLERCRPFVLIQAGSSKDNSFGQVWYQLVFCSSQ